MKSIPFFAQSNQRSGVESNYNCTGFVLNRAIIGLKVSKNDDDIQQPFTKVKRPGIYHKPPTHSISEILK